VTPLLTLPLTLTRLLQMGLDMPFGFLLASLSTKEAALKAAEHNSNPSPNPSP